MFKSKTPFEIRLELLQLAAQILTQKHYADAGGAAMRGASSRDLIVTTAATTENIIAEAEKLNAFVSKANPNH